MSSYSTRALHAEWVKQQKAGLSSVLSCTKIVFRGTGENDVYNPARCDMPDGTVLAAARVEPRHNHDSRVFLFRSSGGVWIPEAAWKPLHMEDPFFVRFPDMLCLGGVVTFSRLDGTGLGWKTVLYNINDIAAPILIFEGPEGMKDLRFLPYPDGAIGLFTRPQGGRAGRGTVGYREYSSFASIDSASLESAPLVSSPDANSWEGVNAPMLFADGRVLLLGHVAWMESDSIRHYYAAVSFFDRTSGTKSPWHIVADRSMIPPGPAKRPDLIDVVFPGGILLANEVELRLLLGVSDAECYELSLDRSVYRM